MLTYPAAIYFFVNSKRDDLHHAIQTGLEEIHRNGQFNKLFSRYFAQTIANAKLAEKEIIKLENKHLPPLTPVDNRTLWFTPENNQLDK